jgi:hypothetical protein
MTTVPPSVRSGSVYASSPPVWNIGVCVIVTSPRCSSWTIVFSVFQAIIRYEICAAFGSPVVPPVNSRRRMSSASTASFCTGPSAAPGAPALEPPAAAAPSPPLTTGS